MGVDDSYLDEMSTAVPLVDGDKLYIARDLGTDPIRDNLAILYSELRTELEGDLAPMTPSAHTHVEADVTDLQAYLTEIINELIGSLSDVTITTPQNNHVLIYSGGAWVNSSLPSGNLASLNDTNVVSVAKGDILVWNGSTWRNLPIGANGTVLTADSAEATGVKWV